MIEALPAINVVVYLTLTDSLRIQNGDAIYTTRISVQVVKVPFRLLLTCLVLSWPIQFSGTGVQGRDRLPNDEDSIRGRFLPDSVEPPEGGAVSRHHRKLALANAERVAFESLEGWNWCDIVKPGESLLGLFSPPGLSPKGQCLRRVWIVCSTAQ